MQIIVRSLRSSCDSSFKCLEAQSQYIHRNVILQEVNVDLYLWDTFQDSGQQIHQRGKAIGRKGGMIDFIDYDLLHGNCTTLHISQTGHSLFPKCTADWIWVKSDSNITVTYNHIERCVWFWGKIQSTFSHVVKICNPICIIVIDTPIG